LSQTKIFGNALASLAIPAPTPLFLHYKENAKRYGNQGPHEKSF